MTDKTLNRFWGKVKKTRSCWLWIGTKQTTGYGVLKIDGKMRYAHRLSWSLANKRTIPKGKCICHTCDRPACVNPNHLFLGTHQDNMRDRDQKGRQASGKRNGTYTKTTQRRRGENHGRAKLTEADVIRIRRLYITGRTQISLGAEFGVSQNQISLIVMKKAWSHVTGS